MVVGTASCFLPSPQHAFTKSAHLTTAQPFDLDKCEGAATRDTTSYKDRIFAWNHATMSSPSVASKLFQATRPTALRCLYHPFVYGLASGKLRQSSFQNYVGQDYFFLHGFADAYKKAGDLAAAKGDEDGVKKFATLADGVAEELVLHKGYAAKWKVELDAVSAQATTLEYVNFVQNIAQQQQERAPADAKISLLCAALAPCMRLYAFLGQQLQEAGYGDASVEENAYVDWVQTYSAADFEGLAVTLEELLDHYAAKEGVAYEDLLAVYGAAMDLEYKFFDAAPGVESVRVPTLAPSLLVVDFDQTLTEQDTTNMIVKASMEAIGDAAAREAKEERFNALASGFYQEYNEKVAAAMPAEDSAAFDLEGMRAFASAMAGFDRQSLVPVQEGKFLAGIRRGELRRRGEAVQLQAAAKEVLGGAEDRGAHIAVISVNWSQDFITGALGGRFVQDLRSPNLRFDSEDMSTGELAGIATAEDKVREMEELVAKHGAAGKSVYVGDSITDALAMLHADVGVVVGSSGSLRRLLKKFKVQLRPLIGSLRREEKEEGVLYFAQSWHDIALAFHGELPSEVA